jgi:demethylmenaquinone methyltransferase/2-methoxy-6-polyprenyl-1,4-benzoquinol methylase
MTKPTQKTHFGYQSVDVNEKQKKVGEVFQSVAQKYDVMNDLMSLGVHRLWKHFSIGISGVRAGQVILDLAGGSGDLTRLLSERVGETGCVYLADINAAMLEVGRNRLIDAGFLNNIRFVQANAECLPFADNQFDCLTMAFGLRNVTNKQVALESMFRVVRPGGKVMILEFSTPRLAFLKPVYDWYSFQLLPRLGQWIAGDSASYQYLAESIRMHPPQDELKAMIEKAGFEDCYYHNLTGGIVALHIAHKY